MIKPDRPPYCSWNSIGVFWRYWLVGGVIWISERILREIRSRHITFISKVIQHPSNVLELQIKKEKTTIRAGQYIFLSCPEISYFQWHPFTLTSAPEEDYLSVHIRIVGDFTKALAKAVGCDFDTKSPREATGNDVSKVVGIVTNPAINRTLPRVMVDGPFGSASEDFLSYETVLLIGAGIGVTPFASILKSIWYRMNNFNHSKPTRLSKVYFTWVIRDFGTAEWFHSLLQAIEEQDTQRRIEINIYLTAKLNQDEMSNIIVQDVGADKDAITSLRAPHILGGPIGIGCLVRLWRCIRRRMWGCSFVDQKHYRRRSIRCQTSIRIQGGLGSSMAKRTFEETITTLHLNFLFVSQLSG